MALKDPTPTDAEDLAARRVRQVELLISTLLRVGVGVSLAVVVVGTVISFIHHADYMKSPSEFKRLTTLGADFPYTMRTVLAGLKQGRGRAVVMAGLLLLIATPVVRVGVSICAFVYEKDGVFVAVTTIVLGLLLLSFFLGSGG